MFENEKELEKESENEKYLMVVKEGKKLATRPLDDGKPLVRGRKKPKLKPQKGALSPSTLFFAKEDKEIFSFHYQQFKNEIITRKGELSVADEYLLTQLCVVTVRIFRKTRMESMYGRFMDRVATQDPIAQSANLLKALGLLNDKKNAEEDTKSLVTKLLSQSIETDNNGTIQRISSYEEWAASKEREKDEVKLTKYDLTREKNSYGDVFDEE
jgi:hypothetical protein